MITFHVVTIFPQLIEAFARESLLKRAQKKKLILIKVHDVRDWAQNPHKTIDDKPYGGGLGMVMRIEPIYKAVQYATSKIKNKKSKIIFFTPRGKQFTQEIAYKLSKLEHIILICGRYEAVDERVAKYIADAELSIGDYVTMGGEGAAVVLIEAVSRLIPNVVGKPNFLKERNRKNSFLEYPQYTRPEVFLKWKVPPVLLSGNHKKIGEWRTKHGRTIGRT